MPYIYKRVAYIEVCDDLGYTLDGPLKEAIKKLEGYLSQVPEEHQDSATIDFETSESYGECEAKFIIQYKRPATREELDKRKAQSVRHRELQIAEMQRQLKELEDSDD